MKLILSSIMLLSIAATASVSAAADSDPSWHWIRINSHASLVAQAYQCNYWEQSQPDSVKTGVSQLYVLGSIDSSYIEVEIHFSGDQSSGVETGLNIENSTHAKLLNADFAGLASLGNWTAAGTQLKFVKYSTGMDMVESSHGQTLRKYTNCVPVEFKK